MSDFVEERVVYDGVPELLRWHSKGDFEGKRVTQVYGYVFNKVGKVLIVQGKHWSLVGGTPEKGESAVETLRREVMEEACVEVENEAYLGYVEVIPQNGTGPFYQLRFAAKVKKEHSFIAQHETVARTWVNLKEFPTYIPWTAKSPISCEERKAALESFKKFGLL